MSYTPQYDPSYEQHLERIAKEEQKQIDLKNVRNDINEVEKEIAEAETNAEKAYENFISFKDKDLEERVELFKKNLHPMFEGAENNDTKELYLWERLRWSTNRIMGVEKFNKYVEELVKLTKNPQIKVASKTFLVCYFKIENLKEEKSKLINKFAAIDREYQSF